MSDLMSIVPTIVFAANLLFVFNFFYSILKGRGFAQRREITPGNRVVNVHRRLLAGQFDLK